MSEHYTTVSDVAMRAAAAGLVELGWPQRKEQQSFQKSSLCCGIISPMREWHDNKIFMDEETLLQFEALQYQIFVNETELSKLNCEEHKFIIKMKMLTGIFAIIDLARKTWTKIV